MASIKDVAKCSRAIKKLKGDSLYPTVSVANFLLNSTENKQEASFHKSRKIDSSYCFTKPISYGKYLPLLTSSDSMKFLNLKHDTYFEEITSGNKYYRDSEIFPIAFNYPSNTPELLDDFKPFTFEDDYEERRTLNLFDLQGADKKWYELQLKGAGLSPINKGNGKLCLRKGVHEFMKSEFLHSIGIPSSRVLQLTLLTQTFGRDGGQMTEPCAVLTRFADTWIKPGSFKYQDDSDQSKQLLDFCLNDIYAEKNLNFDFKEFEKEVGHELELNQPYKLTDKQKLLILMCIKRAKSVGMWQAYGYVKSNPGTDSMNISGTNMMTYHSSFVESMAHPVSPIHTYSDSEKTGKRRRRYYCYELRAQRQYFENNIATLVDILEEDTAIYKRLKALNIGEIVQQFPDYTFVEVLKKRFKNECLKSFTKHFARRLGIQNSTNKDYETLFLPLLLLLEKSGCDYNSFFLRLSKSTLDDVSVFQISRMSVPIDKEGKDTFRFKAVDPAAINRCPKPENWLMDFNRRVKNISNEERQSIATQANPLFVPREHIINEVISHCTDTNYVDLEPLKKLHLMCSNPFDSSKWGDNLKEKEQAWVGEAYEYI